MCERGNFCTFAHGDQEMRNKPDMSKTKICPEIQKKGICLKGDSCTYAHEENELKINPIANQMKKKN